jgi:hypothetical protein
MKTNDNAGVRALLEEWEAELESLDARRAELVPGINLLRRRIGLPEKTGSAKPEGKVTDQQPPVEMRAHKPYLGMSILHASKQYLIRMREPKSPAEIAEAIRSGGVLSRSGDFGGVVRTTLSRRGREVGIESFGEALWGLSEWRPNRARGNSDQGGPQAND